MKLRLILILVLFFASLSTAYAQKPQMAAWLENDHIIVQCYYGKNEPVENALVRILEAPDRKQLLYGRTDETGRFVFLVPDVVREGHGLVIVINSGKGVDDEWVIEAPELYAASSLIAGFDEANLQENQSASASGTNTGSVQHNAMERQPEKNSLPSPSAPGIISSSDDLLLERFEKMFDLKLEKAAASIRQELAQKNSFPTMLEIIGGIGWLIGIIGIIFYFKSKKTS